MSGLKIARGFELPLTAVTEVVSVLATRGAGKSFGSADIVEELYAAQLQFAVVDPMGVYWGLRSSHDGSKAGLGVVVLGGDRGDVPLEPTSGKLIADVVVDTGQSFVLDLSLFDSKAEQIKFMEAFAERLFYRKGPLENRTPLLLVVDEADEFAPQRPSRDEARMLGHMIRLAKRGRTRGIGLLSLTQRSAEFNKAILDLSSAVFFMRTAGPRDRKAIKEWMAGSAPELIALVDARFPKLDTGEALIYSPHWLRLEAPREIRFRMIRTFDSYRTPEPGEQRATPARVAPIDLAKLGKEIAATVERAKENDPGELRKQLRELKQRVMRAEQAPPAETKTVEVEKVVEIPALRPEDVEEIVRQGDRLFALRDELLTALHDVAGAASVLIDQVKEVSDAQSRSPRPHPGTGPAARTLPGVRQPVRTEERRHAVVAHGNGQRPPARVQREREGSGDPAHLKAGARRILETFARHYPMRMTKAQLGTLAKFKISGGTFQTYWSTLKRSGYVEESGGECWITDAGLDYIGHVPREPMSTAEVLEQWRSALKAGARAMLDVVVGYYDASLSKEELAEHVGMTASGGTFQTYLSTLRRNGLVDIDGDQVRASDSLFIGAAS